MNLSRCVRVCVRACICGMRCGLHVFVLYCEYVWLLNVLLNFLLVLNWQRNFWFLSNFMSGKMKIRFTFKQCVCQFAKSVWHFRNKLAFNLINFKCIIHLIFFSNRSSSKCIVKIRTNWSINRCEPFALVWFFFFGLKSA